MTYMVYRRCECQVWPLRGLDPIGRCKRCGVKPEGEPTYEDYAQLAEELAEARRRIRELEGKPTTSRSAVGRIGHSGNIRVEDHRP